MSVTNPKENETSFTAKLLIEDTPYQFLPHLASLYGSECALILQQLHFRIRNPYFEGEPL